MNLWSVLVGAVFLNGCLFDSGSAHYAVGTVQNGALCSSTPSPDGCPACSTRDGALCRGQWYTSDLRCTSDAQCGGQGSCGLGHCVMKDEDRDGIDDDLETEVAELNFPKVLLARSESCGAPRGVIYRAHRHPLNPARLAITYIVLYGADCGDLNGHVGDAETFAITVDLDAQPGAPATVGVQTWAHAGTPCGSTSSCEAAAGTAACAEPAGTEGTSEVVIYSSSDKHANYLSSETCSDNCFDKCSAGPRLSVTPLNVGEPDHPMVRDLTDQGFVTLAHGWNAQLLHVDPWSSTQFGGGGRLDNPLLQRIAPPGR